MESRSRYQLDDIAGGRGRKRSRSLNCGDRVYHVSKRHGVVTVSDHRLCWLNRGGV